MIDLGSRQDVRRETNRAHPELGVTGIPQPPVQVDIPQRSIEDVPERACNGSLFESFNRNADCRTPNPV
jgi:hypothetical protein